MRTRDRVWLGEDIEQKVTAIKVFDHGSVVPSGSVSAGEIGKHWGLSGIQIGDAIGERQATAEHHFAPPSLESVVVPLDPDEKGALRVALAQLAEQDALIDVRQDNRHDEISVSLYGEVQKEVIQCNYSVPDGPPSRRGPLSTAADLRGLTPVVVKRALEQAGTVVCEPIHRFHLEAPAETVGPLDAGGRPPDR